MSQIHTIIRPDGTTKDISHQELLGEARQIIRLHPGLYDRVYEILNTGQSIALFNLINKVNDQVIADLQNQERDYQLAMLGKIHQSLPTGPIIEQASLRTIRIIEMSNLPLSDITAEHLGQSLPSSQTVQDLLQWLTADMYQGKVAIDEIYRDGSLFFRKIISHSL